MANETHPSTDELMALRDGEVDGGRMDALAMHLERCTHCQQTLESLGSLDALGPAVRHWADAVPVTAGLDVDTDTLVEEIYARVRADEGSPAQTHNLVAVPAPAPTMDAKTVTPPANPATVSGTVRPITGARSRTTVRMAAVVGGLVAMAAAAMLLIRTSTPSTPSTPSTQTGATQDTAWRYGGRRPNPLRTMLATNDQNDPSDPGGSEVLSVEGDGDHTSYSVIEVDGAREGTTVAVVWIEDAQ